MDIEGCFFDTADYDKTNKKLGEGTFGKVYVVQRQKDNFLYAAKIIKIEEIFTSHNQMMFLREALILHKLNHPAIVKFEGINFHSFDESLILEPTILTEYYPNGSLKSILDDEKKSIANINWTPTKKYICLLGIADAMRYLHESGILHRDLKPQNILIDSDYNPRVCDFGLSRCFANSLTNSMKITMTGKVGTPLYMAPELLENEDHYGPAVDVYAFSMLAYEIVTGKEPFSDKDGKVPSIQTLLRKILAGERPDLANCVQENMKELIEKCWDQDPKERPSFKSIFEKLSSDFSYFDETVAEDEINDYLEMLSECRNDQIMKVENEEKNAIRTELDKLKNELKICQDKLSQKDVEINSIQKKFNEMKIENESLKEQLKKNEDEKKKLQIEVNNLNDVLNRKKLLHIKICRIHQILKKEEIKNTSFYVTIHLLKQPAEKALKSISISEIDNFIWDQYFDIISTDFDDILFITLYNEDSKKNVKMLSQEQFNVDKLQIERKCEINLNVKLKKKCVGVFSFEIEAYPPNASRPSQIQNKNASEILLKMLLVGDSGSGKTRLVSRFIDNKYVEDFNGTIGVDFKVHNIVIDDKKVRLQIWDSAGARCFNRNTEAYFRSVNAIMIVFDITNRDSFEPINYWFESIKKLNLENRIDVVIVGSKIDNEERRQVSFEEAEKFARLKGCQYFEVSAKENINVNEAFLFLVKKNLHLL